MSRDIEIVRIEEPGDPSVGLPDLIYEIRCLNGPVVDVGVYDEAQAQEVLAEFREKLIEAFSVICDYPVVDLVQEDRNSTVSRRGDCHAN